MCRIGEVIIYCMLASACTSKSIVGTKFDGTYVGTIHPVGTNNAGCFKAPSARMVIASGILEYKYFDRVATYNLAVKDDGSFYGWTLNVRNNQPQLVKGRVLGDQIEADTENIYCKNHLTLERE